MYFEIKAELDKCLELEVQDIDGVGREDFSDQLIGFMVHLHADIEIPFFFEGNYQQHFSSNLFFKLKEIELTRDGVVNCINPLILLLGMANLQLADVKHVVRLEVIKLHQAL